MPSAKLGEKRIWYELNGQGEPLVLLPGGALELRNFSRGTPMPAMSRERGNKSSQACVEN
jgi:hypothetical protein